MMNSGHVTDSGSHSFSIYTAKITTTFSSIKPCYHSNCREMSYSQFCECLGKIFLLIKLLSTSD